MNSVVATNYQMIEHAHMNIYQQGHDYPNEQLDSRASVCDRPLHFWIRIAKRSHCRRRNQRNKSLWSCNTHRMVRTPSTSSSGPECDCPIHKTTILGLWIGRLCIGPKRVSAYETIGSIAWKAKTEALMKDSPWAGPFHKQWTCMRPPAMNTPQKKPP